MRRPSHRFKLTGYVVAIAVNALSVGPSNHATNGRKLGCRAIVVIF